MGDFLKKSLSSVKRKVFINGIGKMFQASKTCSNKNIVGRTKYRTAQIC